MTIVLLEQGPRQDFIFWRGGTTSYMIINFLKGEQSIFPKNIGPSYLFFQKILESILTMLTHGSMGHVAPYLTRSLASSTKSSQRSKHSLLHSFSWSKLCSQRFPLGSGCFFQIFFNNKMMKKEKYCERRRKKVSFWVIG